MMAVIMAWRTTKREQVYGGASTKTIEGLAGIWGVGSGGP